MNRFTVLSLIVSLGAPSIARADLWFDLHIPAPACRPIHEDIAKVKLSEGAWVFESGQFGTVTLFCPLHTSAPSDLGYSQLMGEMRLWYQDPDATATASSVSATLKRREFDDAVDTSVGSTIHSNSNNWSGFITFSTFLNHTAAFWGFSYHVEVTMFRTSSNTATPVFVGLDWQPAPQL